MIAFPQTARSGVTWVPGEFEGMLVYLIVGCAVAVAVFRFVPRIPWPRRMNWRFIAIHLLVGPASAALWLLLTTLIGAVVGAASDISRAQQVKEMMVIGCFLYVVIAGMAYSANGAERAAQAEALAMQTQLATLRSQLQPHFLFNSLHTIVQLIHLDARRAANAAEIVAELLRRTLEDQRDIVPLREEWRFVSQYLAMEQIRFGERLIVSAECPPELEMESVPSFALQTLVENAVQHGAAPRVAPTEIVVSAARIESGLMITVRNSGDVVTIAPDLHIKNAPATNSARGTSAQSVNTGTGLMRLRARLDALYTGAATLVTTMPVGGGYEAVLTVPQNGAQQS